ncbi:MAG: hypothetical protein ABL977_11035 [Candidatus Eisenbacteria bacterium]
MFQKPLLLRPFRTLAPLLLLLVCAAAAPAGAPVKQPSLEDFIAEPGTTTEFKPFMLHADLWLGLDRRDKLDSLVFVLDNGSRACKVLNRDSLWAVDYTWVYPHTLLPPRWYDARSLIHTGDSLHLADDADLKLTFGTLRVGVRAKTAAQAEAEAYRLWPHELPPALSGRLKVKLERAKKALAGKTETEPTPEDLRK